MSGARVLVVSVAFVLSAQFGAAQDLSRYRVHVLDSSIDSVIAATGARAADVRTLHQRPATIQQFEWRAPYTSSGSLQSDPVRGVAFAFCDGALYQVVVSYDRDRTNGLTDRDIIESLAVVYGEPGPMSARSRPAAAPLDATVLAHWDSAASSLTLLRGTYSPEFQLILISKALYTRAQSAIREAIRLDAIDAPRRELEQRKKQVADASAARDKTRTTNKAAFRP